MLQVVSNRMQKTVVVAVSYVVWMPKYKVYQKRVSRHKVTAAPTPHVNLSRARKATGPTQLVSHTL